MEQLTDFSDSRNKGHCIHCGGSLWLEDSNRDHVPTKGLLSPPYPENLPAVSTCQQCNSSFAVDEEYLIAFLGSVLSGTSEPDPARFPKAAGILNHSPRLRSRIDRSRTVQGTLSGDVEVLWEPELDRVARVIVKNARGHAFYELGEPMSPTPASIGVDPLSRLDGRQRNQFEDVVNDAIWPEVGSRMLQRVLVANSPDARVGIYFDSWQDVQHGVYRYAVSVTAGQVLVRTVLYEYLATEVVWESLALDRSNGSTNSRTDFSD